MRFRFVKQTTLVAKGKLNPHIVFKKKKKKPSVKNALEVQGKTIKKNRELHQVDYFFRFGNFNHPKIGDYNFNSWLDFQGMNK